MNRKKFTLVLSIVVLTALSVLGGMGIVLGELDDSPGLGGIGLLLIAISLYVKLKLYDIKNFR